MTRRLVERNFFFENNNKVIKLAGSDINEERD